MQQPPSAKKFSGVRFVVLGWLCAAAAIAYINRTSISVAEEDIRHSLCLTKEEMGLVMSSFFITYAFFQLPAGWISHWWGTRLALPVFSLCWSVLAGLVPLAGSFGFLVVIRLGMGAAQAGIFSCTTNTIAKWFPRSGRGLSSGMLGSFMSIGSALGAILTGFLLETMAWRFPFILTALPGIVWAIWFYAWFRDWPQEHRSVSPLELDLICAGRPPAAVDQAADKSTPWLAIFRSPAMWWINGQQFFRAAGYMFFASWFPTYLKETRGVTTGQAGWLTSLPLLGVVVGSVVGGWLSDWILAATSSRRLARQWLSIVSLATCAILILLAYAIEDALAAVLVISAGSFFSSMAAPCAYSITIDMGGKQVAPVFSLMNMAGNLGAMIFPAVIPLLVTDQGNWDLVLFVFAGIYLSAALFWLGLNPQGTIIDPGVIE